MKFQIAEIPATKPAMARLETADEPDEWIAADADAFEEMRP